MRHRLIILILSVVLAACGGPSIAPVPTTIPTSAPTTAPVEPTAAPTTAPQPAAVLPAPLYILEGGQVVRVEIDGVTRTTITAEQAFTEGAVAVAELTVSPADGTLASIVQGPDGRNTLVLSDGNGQNRRELISDAPIGAPRWSVDGSAIAVQASVFGTADSPWQGGIWVVSAFSGEARLLLASDPYPSDGAGEAWGYAPEAWSPDGSKLLVSRFSLTVEVCEAGILDIASGALTLLEHPEGASPRLSLQCAGGAWAADSSGFYTIVRSGDGLTPPEPGLAFFSVDGQLREAIPARTEAGLLNLVQSQFVTPDGELLAVVAPVERLPDPAVDPGLLPPNAGLYHVAADGTLEQLTAETFSLYGMPAWAPDGSGALVPVLVEGGHVQYRFIPRAGAAITLDLEPTTALAWGR